MHTRTHEETNFPCASCNNHFRTNVELADHVETEHETNLNMSFPDNNDTPDNNSSSDTNRCPLCEEEFGPEFDIRKHLDDHEDVIRWRCQDCEKKFTTYEELTDHVCNTHLQHRFNVENSSSFLTRNMGDVLHINSTMGPFKILLLESTSENDINCTNEVS